jgi:hypothetical protein
MAAGAALQLQDVSHLTDVSAPVEVVALPEVFSLVEKANLQALSVSITCALLVTLTVAGGGVFSLEIQLGCSIVQTELNQSMQMPV